MTHEYNGYGADLGDDAFIDHRRVRYRDNGNDDRARYRGDEQLGPLTGSREARRANVSLVPLGSNDGQDLFEVSGLYLFLNLASRGETVNLVNYSEKINPILMNSDCQCLESSIKHHLKKAKLDKL